MTRKTRIWLAAAAAVIVLAASAAAVVVLQGAGTLSPACKAALARERLIVGANNRTVAALNAQGYNTTSAALPKTWHADMTAVHAVQRACPGSARILMPS